LDERQYLKRISEIRDEILDLADQMEDVYVKANAVSHEEDNPKDFWADFSLVHDYFEEWDEYRDLRWRLFDLSQELEHISKDALENFDLSKKERRKIINIYKSAKSSNSWNVN
jgi:hypothetical protein